MASFELKHKITINNTDLKREGAREGGREVGMEAGREAGREAGVHTFMTR